LATNAYRLLFHVVERFVVGLNDLTFNLIRPASIVSQGRDTHANISLGHAEGLSVVERLDGSEQVKVLLELVGQLVQQTTAFKRLHLPPWSLKGSASGFDSNVDILLGGLVDAADDGFVGRVDDFEGLALDAFDEFTIDESPVGCS